MEEIGELLYRVTVLARTLAAAANAEYQRQAPLQVEVDVSVAGDAAQVVMAPRVSRRNRARPTNWRWHRFPMRSAPPRSSKRGVRRSSGARRLPRGSGR